MPLYKTKGPISNKFAYLRNKAENMNFLPDPINKPTYSKQPIFIGGDTQIRTGDQGVAVHCLTTWLCRLIDYK